MGRSNEQDSLRSVLHFFGGSYILFPMSDTPYKLTVGLEIHAELKTKTKIFCGCVNDPDEKKPNVNVCPICMGHPGTLPVLNREAVKSVLKVGAAIGGQLANFTEFDRKHYFYPDIPKGYQISQYKYPLVSGGNLAGVDITRVHLEEDTATSAHDRGSYSLVDFNRSGIPLMELVTDPCMHSAKEASNFARELQLLLRYLGVAETNMEKGEMRVEANISVSNSDKLGTKVEVKNLNSFKSVERAVECEFVRQSEVLSKGGEIVQETRGFDENLGKTFSQRRKESSHDYRYFPEPDIPKLLISEIPEFSIKSLKEEISELPSEKRKRYADTYGLKEMSIEMFVRNKPLAVFFEKVAADLKDKGQVVLAANYILSDMVSLLKIRGINGDLDEWSSDIRVSPSDFSKLVRMISESKISSRGAKDVLKIMFDEGGDPEKIAKENSLIQTDNHDVLGQIVRQVIVSNEAVVAQYKGGKKSSLQFLVGQGMSLSKGSANPKILADMIKKEILG